MVQAIANRKPETETMRMKVGRGTGKVGCGSSCYSEITEGVGTVTNWDTEVRLFTGY